MEKLFEPDKHFVNAEDLNNQKSNLRERTSQDQI